MTLYDNFKSSLSHWRADFNIFFVKKLITILFQLLMLDCQQ